MSVSVLLLTLGGEPCCILQNDPDFLGVLKSSISAYITGKGLTNQDAILRFIHSAESVDDLHLLVSAFISGGYPSICSVSWTITSSCLPEHGHNGPAEVVVEPTFSEPVIEHEVLE